MAGLLLGLVIGCGGSGSEAPGMDACGTDLACVEARVLTAWPDDPDAVLAHLGTVQDERTRATLVEALVEDFPDRAEGLCELLEPGINRSRCEGIRTRADLWTSSATGEQAVVLSPSPTFRPPAARPSRPADCGSVTTAHACRDVRAHEAAMGRDLVAAAELCAGIDDARWQGACLVQAVEEACSRDHPGPCGVAVELCAAAGPFRTPCLLHAAEELSALAPASAAESGDRWAMIGGRLREARQRLQGIDPILADRFVQRTWAEATMLAYGTARQVGGNPLDFVPSEAAHHVRAGIAWRLSSQKDSGTLRQRAEHVLQAERRRTRDPIVVPMQPGRVEIPALWAADLPGESEIPWLPFLQDTRRAWSSDPEIDARLCVLESAARAYPLDVDMLVEGLGDGEWVVRWTAARLLAAVRPGHPALGHVVQDSDPRVAARASGEGLGG